MTDYNINLTIQNIWSIIRIVIDIGIMWFILYYAIKFVRNNSRTIQIFKGIFIVVLVNVSSKLLGLTTVEYFSDTIISWGFLAIIIIFQPEIRGVLERLGKTNAFSKINTLLANEKEKLVDQLYQATVTLSKSKIGALISIEQSQSMQDFVKTGIEVNATVSKELLCSVFMTTTPLHDGAVIIRGDKVACASAYFPPTSVNLSSRYGARHRAALGISEVCDCLTIVVSEETSAISIAEHGSIFNVNEKQLKDYLRRVICEEEIVIGSSTKQRSSLLVSDDPQMIIENEAKKLANKNTNNTQVRQTPNNNYYRQVRNEPDMKVPFNNRIKYENEAGRVNNNVNNSNNNIRQDRGTRREKLVDLIFDDDAFEVRDNAFKRDRYDK